MTADALTIVLIYLDCVGLTDRGEMDLCTRNFDVSEWSGRDKWRVRAWEWRSANAIIVDSVETRVLPFMLGEKSKEANARLRKKQETLEFFEERRTSALK